MTKGLSGSSSCCLLFAGTASLAGADQILFTCVYFLATQKLENGVHHYGILASGLGSPCSNEKCPFLT